MKQPEEISFTLQTTPARRSAKRLVTDPPSGPPLARIARLVALAIHLDGLLAQHTALDRAELARLGNISPTRLSQILNLLHLAPDLQERLLWLAVPAKGRDPITEKQIRHLAHVYDWEAQRQAFARLLAQ